MKICLFNCTQDGSTGSIVKNLAVQYQKMGHQVLCVFGQKKQDWASVPCLFTIKNSFEKYRNKFESRWDGRDGFVNTSGTKKILLEIAKFHPDIFHLHNMHGEWINIENVINFAKNNGIQVCMTAHDCWIETGRCAHYKFNKCNQYITKCGRCPHRLSYPKTYLFDRSRHFWYKKRKIISDIKLIFTPSHWLANEIRGAGIETPLEVIGTPYCEKEFFPIKREEQFQTPTIGFCSFVWDETKGLSMAQMIAHHYIKMGYRVIFIGMNPSDSRLPKGAKGIAKTKDRQQMADLYRSFDCFVNPTRQDTHSATNIEAMACGTPVVTSRCCGCYEMLTDKWKEGVVEEYALNSFIKKIDFMLQRGRIPIPTDFKLFQSIEFAKNTIEEYRALLSNRELK